MTPTGPPCRPPPPPSGSAWRVGDSGADTGFDELRDLCTAAGDKRSLAIGMTGHVVAQYTNAHYREASGLATEHIALLESIGDPTLTVGLSFAALAAKGETGRWPKCCDWRSA